MPFECGKSMMVPIYKNKNDIKNCVHYRGIKLTSHTMELQEINRTMVESRINYFGEPTGFYAW